jgi:hypothetical protein
MRTPGIGSHTLPNQGQTQTWLTPPRLIKLLGPFDLDPCPAPDPKPWDTASNYCVDGLTEPWSGFVFCNPPYNAGITRWIEKMVAHGNGLLLIFARTDTPYCQLAMSRCDGLLFIRGRLYFHYPDGRRGKGNAGGPSMLVAFGLNAATRLYNIRDSGTYFTPMEPHP